MQATLFAPSREETKADDRRGALGFRQRLLSVLGDGRDWEYTGDCNERQHADGKCSCGHLGLRFEFMLRNKLTGNTCIVGSSCVETYAETCPDMVNAIRADVERLDHEAAERKRAARELTQGMAIQEALAEFDRVAWELDRRMATGAEPYTVRDAFGRDNVYFRQVRRTTWAIYKSRFTPCHAAQRLANFTDGQHWPERWKQYKSKPAFIRAIKAQTEYVQRLGAGKVWEGS